MLGTTLLMLAIVIAAGKPVYAASGFTTLWDGFTSYLGEVFNISYVTGYATNGTAHCQITVTDPDGQLVLNQSFDYQYMYTTIETSFIPEKTGDYTIEGYCFLSNGTITTKIHRVTLRILKECDVHTYDEWTVIKEPTCKDEGEAESVCTVCGKTGTKTLPKTEDHSWGEWKVTKTATALTAGIKEHTCTVCGEKQTTAIKKLTPKLKLGKTAVKLAKTKSVFLKVTFAKGDRITVKSSDKKIAAADFSAETNKLTITAQKKAGTAKITVKTKTGKTAVVKVTVPKVKTTKITCKAVKVKKGKKVRLKPEVTPSFSDDEVTFRSADTEIAAVTAKGVVKGKKKGTTTITVKSGKKSVKVKVTVK